MYTVIIFVLLCLIVNSYHFELSGQIIVDCILHRYVFEYICNVIIQIQVFAAVFTVSDHHIRYMNLI